MENEQNKLPTTPTPEVTPTTGVDLNVYGKSVSELASVKPTEVTAQMASDPYNKAAAVIEQISNNANNQIAANSRETIGTDRGGQRALLTGANDTYMTRRYSSPVTASLAGQIRAVAAQAGLNAAMSASLARAEEEYNKAKKAAQKRAAARAAAAAAAAAAQSQQVVGSGGVEATAEETNNGENYSKVTVGKGDNERTVLEHLKGMTDLGLFNNSKAYHKVEVDKNGKHTIYEVDRTYSPSDLQERRGIGLSAWKPAPAKKVGEFNTHGDFIRGTQGWKSFGVAYDSPTISTSYRSGKVD